MAESTKQIEGHQADSKAREKAEQEIYVIGIGASAGGLQALEALFSSVPQDSVAYVIVQHLATEHRSFLTQLVSQYSVLEVKEAQHNMPVQTNKVYVIPNNKELTIQNNLLQLLDKSSAGRARTVDTFFTSLAADKKHRSIGIILSGTGMDGSEGVVAIKKAGGMVIVQDPVTARFDSMPRNAINTGYTDYILAPELMPSEIFNYVKVTPISNDLTELVNSETEGSFFQILDMVHERTGIDFSNYKRPTIIRRISRRMAALNFTNLSDYFDYMDVNAEEVVTLSKEFLIGVTKFFRDEEAYQVLADKVIPALVDSKKENDQLRIWVAGCSSGEEPYSIAILVREYMDKVKKELEVKIFASDIDRDALDFAGKGLYPESSLTTVSPERLHEYFLSEEGKYRVCQRVRRMVIFAPHNVVNDPPFSRIDLVSCRNMLIYLNPMLQKKVIDKFHYALQVGGYLFLGSSESIGDQKSFEEINKKWKIFRNTEPARSLGMIETFSGTGMSRRPNISPIPSFTRDLSAKQLLHHNFSELLNETVLEEYGYAAVYVDENYDVLHGAGKFKNYLDLPEQNFTFNLLKLVPQDLSVSLGTMLRRAILEKEKLSSHNIQVRDGKSLRYINVVVKPYLADRNLAQKFILVLFSEEQARIPLATNEVVTFYNNQDDSRVQELELELQYTKDDLQAVVEELETANEELQSTNEELLSSNEELQSTNEELQSLNEELHTINTEHQYKIKALVELDDDLNNYFRSTDIGQIFVDRTLVIRKFTPAATKLINLIDSDIGRSIYQISNNLHYDKLIEDVRDVIASNNVIEKEVQDKNGMWYQMRILPYITQDRKIDGAIIIFIKINELKSLHLLHSGILDSSPNAILALKAVRNQMHTIVDFNLMLINHKAQELFGRPAGKLVGKRLWKEYPQLLEQDMFDRLAHVVNTGEQLDVELPQVYNKKPLWLHIVAVNFDDGLVLTMHDITERKLYEQALQKEQAENIASAERFRTLLEAVPHITWTNLPNGENTSFNQLWYDYTGLTEEESVKWGWKKAIHPDDREEFIPNFMSSLRSGEIFTAEARVLNKTLNQYRWHLIQDVPIRNETGAITMWIGTATDIQEQKDAEEAKIQLRLLQQREVLSAILQTQEAERSRISEALHNGLGQILYATKLNLSNLEAENTKQEKTIETIDKLLSESVTITRDISSELTPSVLKTFGLKTAVEEIISRISNSGLKISLEVNGFKNRLDYTVELSLYRIIQELLNNLIKHAQATEARIFLTCDDKTIYMRIEDNGIGIDKEDFNKLKGIGLSSIQNRVELLQGKMEVQGEKGKGTVFEITCTI
ncbi:PAS domain S-box protein [Pontibacter diazotrophicus]|uniref:protein-glutamate O-methyltransferase n=1 Tax=Pontibacter diazotrophicus TaxID=1400979 RepID=A0A3D8LAT9_9BACT|nr:CheR family methyltransferase [Pontibacter diazotrophicus]RDV14473.1 PAS domain S-box protein [Pontibacter diazotrophicus]